MKLIINAQITPKDVANEVTFVDNSSESIQVIMAFQPLSKASSLCFLARRTSGISRLSTTFPVSDVLASPSVMEIGAIF
eukprot:5569422-Amphidinium_carterae.2